MSPRNAALLALGVGAVSFSGVLVRLADAPPIAIAFYRNAFAAAILLPIAVMTRREEFRRLDRRKLSIAVLSGALLAAHFATWIPSLSFTTVAASSVLVTTSPIWIAVLGRLVGERMSRGGLAGVALALAGTAVISGGGLSVSARAMFGDALALAGAVFAAGYVLAGRSLRRQVSLLTYVGIVYTTCAALLGLAMIGSRTPFTGYSPGTWLVFALLTLGPQFLGHTTFNYLLAHLEAGVVAIAIMAEPVGATILAWWILAERPGWTTVIGGAVVLAGVYLAIAAQTRGLIEAPAD